MLLRYTKKQLLMRLLKTSKNIGDRNALTTGRERVCVFGARVKYRWVRSLESGRSWIPFIIVKNELLLRLRSAGKTEIAHRSVPGDL